MTQYHQKYDPRIHTKLDQADWDAILPRVLKYAVFRAKMFTCRGDVIEPKDLVLEAVARAYGIGNRGNYRNWNSEKCPDLGDFLIGIIRSMTSHDAEHGSGFPEESLFHDDGTAKDEKILKYADEAAGALMPKTPETEIIVRENLQALKELLDRISVEDENLGLVIVCIEDGISKPRDIAEKTGFDINKVNDLLRKLRRKCAEFKPQMKKQSSKERREEWA